MTLGLKTLKEQFDSSRIYYKSKENRLYCVYKNEPNYFLSATKDGEPSCNLKHNLRIIIDGNQEQLNINPNNL